RKLLEPADCCCTVVASLEEAIEDEHFRSRGLFRYYVEQGGRRMPMTVLPLAPGFRRPAEGDRQVAPLGQDTGGAQGSDAVI
ncbi:MAG TPA: CoA transferase, partial [Microvirga sp.]|nr:CoA transferase [Microvirga sp.]